MILKVNGVTIASPKSFTVSILDIDDSSSVRAANGELNRDRVAVKRQIEMSWGELSWAETSTVLKSMKDLFFEFYYPDPETGGYTTKTFYVGNRPCPAANSVNGEITWSGLAVSLTEK